MTDGNTATAVGDDGAAADDSNGGATFRCRQDSGSTRPLLGAVVHRCEQRADRRPPLRTILRTTNGGATWVAQDSGIINITLSACR